MYKLDQGLHIAGACCTHKASASGLDGEQGWDNSYPAGLGNT